MKRLKLKNKNLTFCLISFSLISFISNAQIKTPQIDDRIMIRLADHRSGYLPFLGFGDNASISFIYAA